MSDSDSPTSSSPIPIPVRPVADLPERNEYDLVVLDPARVRLFRGKSGVPRAEVTDPALGGDRTFLSVKFALAFPFSRPDTYVGLRDHLGKEIGILPELADMDPESRALLDEELARRYFLPKVLRVNQMLEERGGLVFFDVDTDKGKRQFYVQNPRDSIQTLSPGRMLVTDKDGVRYEFPNIAQLEPQFAVFFDRVS